MKRNAPPFQPEPLLSKTDLCTALRWGRPRLDRRLDADPAFPVAQRGRRGGGWRFDLAAVRRYLGADAADQPAAHAGELSARQRVELAKAALLEVKLRKARGELIPVERFRLALDAGIGRLAAWLDRFPEQAVKILGLPEDRAELLQHAQDGWRNDLVDEIERLLADPAVVEAVQP